MRSQLSHIKVWVVEQDESRIALTKLALADHEPPLVLQVLPTVEAMQSALKAVVANEMAVPALLLMNLRLPKLEGWAMLRTVRLHPQFNRLPIVVYSAQYTQQEVQMSYVLGANCFVTKPYGLEDFAELLSTKLHHWLGETSLAESSRC